LHLALCGRKFNDLGGEAMIRKVEGGYKVVSSKGKNLGRPVQNKGCRGEAASPSGIFQAQQRLKA
jgi:hypothetical protein